MYTLLSEFSQMFTSPVSLFLNSYEHSPLIVALLLGLIGSVAPCQLTGNISAITLYGNRSIQLGNNAGEIIFFVIGKVAVYSLIGWFAWIFGQSFETKMTEFFPIFRKLIGPLLMVTGLVLIGILKLKILSGMAIHIPTNIKEGKVGSFLLGAIIAFAFCPTMFVLFFVWLMPTVASTSYGFVLPMIFGVATAIPFIIILTLLWSFDIKGKIMKKSLKAGRVIQRGAGALLIIIGIVDLITYWGV
ncbi:sulfite exporter TauE/SafE family protein [Lysinibacillus yapensis]|uniref:Sulfite exporter TauE/SafE family protein n=1 Tax=Ureibacillus yapensis TaxID=2304605 RepID=A0A396S9P6_9BACL|nr:sulfite exporter TauE/SafE family protein [Lysinibacillus yapensis]RHW37511.1 sulfite exporter TauE/SafE family protein [Lysinibacillus yapensis]